MTIAVIILTGALCLIAGWAARQMQADRENTTTIEQQREDIVRLTRENEGLRRDVADHTGNLEMVLTELNTSA